MHLPNAIAMVLLATLVAQATIVHGTNKPEAIATADLPTTRAGSAFRAGFTKTTTNHVGATTITARSVSKVEDRRTDTKAGGIAYATASSSDPTIQLAAKTDTQATLQPLAVAATAAADVGGVTGAGTGADSRTDAWVEKGGFRTPLP